jgi:diguanylate cyclase (GGDEF)-like protein/PAS domain S-box-containing protein
MSDTYLRKRRNAADTAVDTRFPERGAAKMARGRQLPSEPAGQAARSGHGPARSLRRSPQAILTSEARLVAVVSNAPVILFATDNSGTFTLSEGKGLERLGLHPSEVVGQSLFDLYSTIPAIIHSVRRALAGETLTSTSEVGELVFETYYAPILDRRGRVAGMVGVATDVTERTRALEQQMEHARRDPLTGVLNHGAITAYLAEQLGRADLEHVAVAMIDVDGMKAVNDTYGHLSGDAVLQTVARALASDDAVVGRYGGDEFLVVLAGADRDCAEAYLRRAACDIREAKVTDEETSATIRLPASIGMAVFPDEAATLVELIRAADSAMYAAKRNRALESGEVARRLDDRVSAMIADLVPLLTSPGDLNEKLKLVGARLSTGTGYDAVDCQIFRSHGQPAESTLRAGADDVLAEGWRAQQQAHSDVRKRPINVILAKTRRPIILEDLSSDDRLTPAERALLAQAGLQSAIIAPMLWDGELAGTVAVARNRRAAFDPRDAEFLAGVANQVTAIVRMASLVDGLQSATERLSDAQAHTVTMLAAAAEAHDHTTGLHLESVRALAEGIAREMGYGEGAVRELGLAATLHDIGKIRVPDSILSSPVHFDIDDWEIARVWDVLKQHSVWGAEFLGQRPEFALAAKVARWHHERWDGAGYPDGIAAEQIPEEVTIVTVADAFDAIVHERPYRAARPFGEAMAEIVRCRGIQFNPVVVDALVRLHERGALPGQVDDLRMAA